VPLYEYQCEQCQHRFEKIQSFSGPDPESCPKCGGRIQRMLAAPAVQFKGSGWYATDYKKSGQSTSKGESSASGPSSDSSSSSAGDSKKESKSESKAESKADNSSKS
jgi:putative FmdB family regulatory protein